MRTTENTLWIFCQPVPPSSSTSTRVSVVEAKKARHTSGPAVQIETTNRLRDFKGPWPSRHGGAETTKPRFPYGDRGSFGGSASESSSGDTSGQENYLDHGPAEPMHVKSISIDSVTCRSDQTRAIIQGKATVNNSGSHDYAIDVQDLGEPGKLVDTYRMRLLDTGYDSGEQPLRGGNVQIR